MKSFLATFTDIWRFFWSLCPICLIWTVQFQDVVEERFRTEYLIALVVAIGLFLTIIMIVVSLLVLRCKRTREKRRRRRNSFGGSSSGGNDNSYTGGGQTADQRSGSVVVAAANAAGSASSATAAMIRSRNGECSSTETIDTQVSPVLITFSRNQKSLKDIHTDTTR